MEPATGWCHFFLACQVFEPKKISWPLHSNSRLLILWKNSFDVHGHLLGESGQAIHVLDRFHIMTYLGKALDEVRAGEARELKAKGYEPVLTKTRLLLLKRSENLSEKQEVKLSELLQYNLRSVRAYLLKAEFQFFWDYVSPHWAGQFLDKWRTKTMRSKIDPMKKVARMLRNHRVLLLNWFHAKGRFSSGVVEGFDTKAKMTLRKSYGFRTPHGAEAALYHALGLFPVPECAHRFC